MVKRRPPHLRTASIRDKAWKHTCHTCKSMNRKTGLCARYSYPVARAQTCDTWSPR